MDRHVSLEMKLDRVVEKVDRNQEDISLLKSTLDELRGIRAEVGVKVEKPVEIDVSESLRESIEKLK